MSESNAFPDQPTTIRTALTTARRRLAKHSDTAALEARVLLAHILQKDKTWLLAHPEDQLSPHHLDEFNHAVQLLVDGKPLPYILGSWEFYGLTIKITPDVLIPRPETELLVETALDWLSRRPGISRAAEAGTGSGCVAVSLAVNAPTLILTATDISPQALEIAGQNADHHRVSDRITFLHSNLLADLTGPFDLIAANLPYIPSNTLRGLEVSRQEPTLALDGGADGLDLIRRLLDQAVDLLAADGLVLLEIEKRQGEQVKQLAQAKFPGASIKVKPDLAGNPRLVEIQR